MKERVALRLTCIVAVLSALSLALDQVKSASAEQPGRVNPSMNLVTVSGSKLAHACRPEHEGTFEDGVCLVAVVRTDLRV